MKRINIMLNLSRPVPSGPELTPGQIAYESYCQAADWKSFGGSPLPQWIDVIPRIKIAWEAAAHDVLIRYDKRQQTN